MNDHRECMDRGETICLLHVLWKWRAKKSSVLIESVYECVCNHLMSIVQFGDTSVHIQNCTAVTSCRVIFDLGYVHWMMYQSCLIKRYQYETIQICFHLQYVCHLDCALLCSMRADLYLFCCWTWIFRRLRSEVTNQICLPTWKALQSFIGEVCRV